LQRQEPERALRFFYPSNKILDMSVYILQYQDMRTSVDIPDVIHRRLKNKALGEGRSLRELIVRAIERELKADKPERRRVKIPVIESKHPGTLYLDNDKIFELIPFP
jgi:hypothetical protein